MTKDTHDHATNTPDMLRVARRRITELERTLARHKGKPSKADAERFRLAMEATRDGIWDWDLPTGKVWYSPGYAAMLGLESSEVPNRIESWLELLHPDDKAAALAANADCIEHRCEDFEVEFRMRARDGGWRWILGRGRAVTRDEDDRAVRMVGTHTDITARKRTEEELRQSERRFREITDSLPVRISQLDEDLRYIFANARYEHDIGVRPEDITDKRVRDCIHPDIWPVLEPELRAALDGVAVHFEYDYPLADGSVRHVYAHYLPRRDDDGQVEGVYCWTQDITARKAAESRYRAMFETIDKGVAVYAPADQEGSDFIFRDFNPAAERITGFRRDQVIGRGLLEFFPAAPDLGLPDALRRALRTGRSVSVPAAYFKDNRHQGWRENLVCPLPGGEVVAIFTDVTARVESRLRLAESEERFRTLFEHSPEPTFIFGLNDCIIDANPAACDLLGHDRETLRSMSLPDIQAPEVRGPSGRTVLDQLEHDGPFEDVGLRSDGTRVPVEVSNRRVDLAGRTVVLTVARDISAHKQIEEHLVRAKEAAEEASRVKTEFLANMSHEIRTPLNGLSGMLQLLKASALLPEQREYAENALLSSQRLAGLLSDILDISVVESGVLRLCREPFGLRQVLDSVERLYGEPGGPADVPLALAVSPDTPDALVGDEQRLRQILFNLVGNSFKFTEAGQVRLDVQPLPVAGSDRCRLLFTVTDTGIGIPDDKLDSLFEPFTQAGSGYTRNHQGAGLGLSICKRLTALMGGRMAVDSEPGKGTAVYLSIPFALGGALTEAERAKPASAPVMSLNVLLAEDDRVSALAAERLLAGQGCRVSVAGDGLQAVEALREEHFDVVLMDVQMPVMDGVEATRAIRAGRAGAGRADVPVVALTAYAMAGDCRRFLDAGMDGYVAKPLEWPSLQAELARVLAAPRKG